MADGVRARSSPASGQPYGRGTLDNPPFNIFGQETACELNEVIAAIEADPDVQVAASLRWPVTLLRQPREGGSFAKSDRRGTCALGGGPMARLPRLMGRGRALEVLFGGADIDGDLIASVQCPQAQDQAAHGGRAQTNADAETRLGHCTGELGKE